VVKGHDIVQARLAKTTLLWCHMGKCIGRLRYWVVIWGG